MRAIDELLRQPAYATRPGEHRGLLRAAVREAIGHHYANCPAFARWYRKQGADPNAEIGDLAQVPFLPVSIFKRLPLESVGEKEIVRVLKSSATSSQTPSRVVLDRVTRDRQARAEIQCDHNLVRGLIAKIRAFDHAGYVATGN